MYHDVLYERQDQLNALDATGARDLFVALAGELGLDADRFAADLDGNVFTDLVTTSAQEAATIGMPGTPALLVNGQVVGGQGLPPYEVWEQYVESTVLVNSMPQYDRPPEMTVDSTADYRAHVTMANGGKFTIDLFASSAPVTVNSFIFLANQGWFDGVTFHRVLPGFVAQTGDPTGTGRGGPGYEFVNEIDPALSHDSAGVVAMANSGPNTNGSQWYITLAPTPQLDGAYTIFGRISAGLEDVVYNISPRDPQTAGAAPGDAIQSIEIEVVQ